MLLRDVLDSDLPTFFAHQRRPGSDSHGCLSFQSVDAFMAHWRLKVLGDVSAGRKRSCSMEWWPATSSAGNRTGNGSSNSWIWAGLLGPRPGHRCALGILETRSLPSTACLRRRAQLWIDQSPREVRICEDRRRRKRGGRS